MILNATEELVMQQSTARPVVTPIAELRDKLRAVQQVYDVLKEFSHSERQQIVELARNQIAREGR